MILSASRRTDIPCYYSEWFMNRLKAGFVLTRNPMNHSQVSKINLSPEVIDCIVFWTKDAKNIFPYLEIINEMGYPYYFQFTVTPYDNAIEKKIRDKNGIVNTFMELSQLIGKERVLWRYDPIIFNDNLTINYHKEQFGLLCERLHDYTESVTISFVDGYKKIKTDIVREITIEEMLELSSYIGKTAKNAGLAVRSCSERTALAIYGIERSSCIDKNVIEKICGYGLATKQDKNQREFCECIESIDIGTYNSCSNGCTYCYANKSENTAAANLKKHNIHADMLNDSVTFNDKVIERKVKSFKKSPLEMKL